MIAANNLAVGQLWGGNLEQAAANLLAARTRCRELGIGLTELNVHGHLALLDVIHGRLPAAAQRAEAALELADRRGWTAEPQALGLHAAVALVAVEQGRSAVCGRVGIDGLVEGGAGTDVACRLVMAIAAINHAAARGDGPLADEAVIRLDGVQLQAGRLPPLLAGWCSAAHAAADLTAGRFSDAIDRARAAIRGRDIRTPSVRSWSPGRDCSLTSRNNRSMLYTHCCQRLLAFGGPRWRPGFLPPSRRIGCIGTSPR